MLTNNRWRYFDAGFQDRLIVTIPRNITLIIHFVFDQLLPPLLRDQKWFMWLPFKLLFKDKATAFFDFKDNSHQMTELEFKKLYEDLFSVHIQRETDLNTASVMKISDNVFGKQVLDIACGRGYLARHLAEHYQVTAADMVIDSQLIDDNPHIEFHETNLQKLPFSDQAFDTVICTHTLEHVRDPSTAIRELRRVCRHRLIIVLPCQRPYKYTFDLHLHFFPYHYDVLSLMQQDEGQNWQISCEDAGGDWFYMESNLSMDIV